MKCVFSQSVCQLQNVSNQHYLQIKIVNTRFTILICKYIQILIWKSHTTECSWLTIHVV